VKSLPVSKNGIPVHRRAAMIGKVFFDDGKSDQGNIPEGMWLVRAIKDNEYLCVRSPDCRNWDADPNSTQFDIGHVIRTVTHGEQQQRNSF
jgi:hypothetical protein